MRILQVQTRTTYDAVSFVIETMAITPDIVFGDSFHIVNTWTVISSDIVTAGPFGLGHCKLCIQVGVVFVKNRWRLDLVRHIITKRAYDDSKKTFHYWLQLANEWIRTHADAVSDERNQPKQRLTSSPHSKS